MGHVVLESSSSVCVPVYVYMSMGVYVCMSIGIYVRLSVCLSVYAYTFYEKLLQADSTFFFFCRHVFMKTTHWI